jgi:uncharacterized protein (TIGR03118 family)
MNSVIQAANTAVVLAAAVCLLPSPALAQHYIQTNLVSNTGNAPVNDPNLQNAWGLIAGPTTPWWVSNNNDGTSTLYSISTNANGQLEATLVPINPAPDEFVKIPNAPSQPPPGSPTGVIFNGTGQFLVAPGKPALFIFVTEDGTVQGWNPGVNKASAVIVVDHSQVPDAANGAVYKGATIASVHGNNFIFAANFRSGHIDVYDSNFKQVRLSEGQFKDDQIPRDFAPFNVQGVGPNFYVTYAEQDAAKHDPVGGAGLGFVDVFDGEGRLLQRLEHGDFMNAPWGVVWATPPFGEFSNTILIGQFRGGNVAAFNPVTGHFLGNMLNPDGSTLKIDGLWALRFGNDGAAGPATTLVFTAGPEHETNGLFGTLTALPAELAEAIKQ